MNKIDLEDRLLALENKVELFDKFIEALVPKIEQFDCDLDDLMDFCDEVSTLLEVHKQ